MARKGNKTAQAEARHLENIAAAYLAVGMEDLAASAFAAADAAERAAMFGRRRNRRAA